MGLILIASALVLQKRLRTIDGRGYKSYQAILGHYDYGSFVLYIDHVQSDPFAPPSRLRARVEQGRACFPQRLYSSRVRQIALSDFITRGFATAMRRYVRGRRGTGGSGVVRVDEGGQEIMERTSCLVNDDFVEIRFSLGLPAAGRRCLGEEAEGIFFSEIPKLVESSLFYSAYDPVAPKDHVEVCEDQEVLREELAPNRLVAFVANGSVLPRESGASDRPLSGKGVVSFTSPDELEVELKAPNRGVVRGMGVPEGVTVIIGGGYHGKSTLLAVLSRGVYNHVPGDGREYAVSRRDTVKIRAEDGRRIEKVDISPFISNLPFGQDTTAFETDNASGSTSQAANIVEAMECGTSLLLMDEDTCATNFMIRDSRMQRLVPKEKEPITPFIDQVRNLYREHGVSTIIVMGGCSDYFDVADTVIAMDRYRPKVVTGEAHRLAEEQPTQRLNEAGGSFGDIGGRVLLRLDPYRRGKLKVASHALGSIEFGSERIDISLLEQLVDPSQARAIADMMVYALRRGYVDGRRTLGDIIKMLFSDIDRDGLEVISPFRGQHPGDYALPRPQEVAFALDRLRSLEVRRKGG